jgi:REP element-mobilizing transposase RayT
LIIGGFTDHVHILASLGRSISQAQWVKELKRVSNGWMHEQHGSLVGFAWQSGYGTFSADPRNLDGLKRYIANQEEHHRTVLFQEEFLALLAEYGIEADERYIWD